MTKIIAELCQNHNGDIKVLEDMVHAAAESGADFAKIQSIHSSDLKDYDIYNINLYGRKGMMSFKNIGRDIEFYDVIDSPEHTGFTELSPVPTLRLGGKPRNQFKFMLDNAIDCIENNAKPLGDADDAIIALKVLFAMKESAANKGRMVDLKI